MKRRLCMLLSFLMVLSVLPVVSAKAASLYWPVPGHTTKSGYYSSSHPAIDISDAGIEGATIVAAMSGTVQKVFKCTDNHYQSDGDCYGFGTGVVIMGTDGRCYQYAHMYPGSIPSGIAEGNYVNAGTMIGRVGNTGNSRGAHLHFGIAVGNKYWENLVDPAKETYVYLNEGDFTPISKTISWGSDACQAGDTDAYLYTKASSNLSGTFTQAGISIWQEGNLVGSKTENISTSGSYLEVWYNVNEELGLTLAPGATYTYQFFVVFDGTKYTSEVKSFTTTGVGISWGSDDCQVKDTDAYIFTKASAKSAGTFTQAGVTIWKNNSPVCAMMEHISTYSSYLDIWYNITEEMEVALQPGTTYTYQFYVVYNGAKYTGDVKSFTTTCAHNVITDKAVAASCTNTGLTEGSHCSVCGTTIVAQIKIAATGHRYDSTVTSPSCTEGGYTTYTCDNCGDSYTGDKTTATGHKEVTVKGKAAACTATGLTEGKKCTACNTVTVKQETIAAKGHSAVKDKAVAATCGKEGKTEGSHCSVCNTVITAQKTVEATGNHTYSDDRDASCNVCGHTRDIYDRPTVHMFRMYDPNSGEHFYTGSVEERENLVAAGWNYEGVGFTFPLTTGKPVYRLYDPVYGEHLYTMDEEEKARLEAAGWSYEGIAFNSGFEDEVPQYRLHNPNETRGAYHFTASIEERDYLLSIGWEYQGIGWYSCWK